eukprot:jgi/Mesen1/4742/ME000241S03769
MFQPGPTTAGLTESALVEAANIDILQGSHGSPNKHDHTKQSGHTHIPHLVAHNNQNGHIGRGPVGGLAHDHLMHHERAEGQLSGSPQKSHGFVHPSFEEQGEKPPRGEEGQQQSLFSLAGPEGLASSAQREESSGGAENTPPGTASEGQTEQYLEDYAAP